MANIQGPWLDSAGRCELLGKWDTGLPRHVYVLPVQRKLLFDLTTLPLHLLIYTTYFSRSVDNAAKLKYAEHAL